MRERQQLEHELRDLGLPAVREVIGQDTREKVPNSLAVPFRWICRIRVTLFSGGRSGESSGTGVLVGPRHVLTCAHVIYPLDQENGRPIQNVQKIEVFPAQNGADEPLGSFGANGWAIHPRWFRGREVDCTFDYGLIRLRDNLGGKTFRALGGRPLGFWGSPDHGHGTRFRRLDPATLAGRPVVVAGYPYRRGLNELAARVMRVGRGQVLGSAFLTRCSPAALAGRFLPVVDPTSRVLLHDADTSRAQSGCPVWLEDGRGGLDLIGIHQGELTLNPPIQGIGTANIALRLTREFLAQVREWQRTLADGRV